MHVASSDDTVSLLARELAQVLGRVVLNQTGLSGRYDFTLRWTPDDALPPMPNGAPDPSEPPGIFTAIQEQLGLKLESSRGPVPYSSSIASRCLPQISRVQYICDLENK